MYSLSDYGAMIADASRVEAYSKAIAKAVQPGDSVLEIGCGPGAFALLACQAGARKVYAIDSDEIVHFARDLAIANGFVNHNSFWHERIMTDLDLTPEEQDYIRTNAALLLQKQEPWQETLIAQLRRALPGVLSEKS